MNSNAKTQSSRRPLTRAPILACALLAFAPVAACSPTGSAPGEQTGDTSTEPPLAGADIGGPFTLTSSTGETVRWEDLRGRYAVIYFGYAYCPDVCPTDMQRTAQGLRVLKERNPALAARVQPVFITIDPARDTPEVVGEFTAAFSDDIIGLTGSQEAVKQAADAFRVYYERGEPAPGGGYLVDHTNIVYFFDPAGEPLAMLPTDKGPEAIADEIERWAK